MFHTKTEHVKLLFCILFALQRICPPNKLRNMIGYPPIVLLLILFYRVLKILLHVTFSELSTLLYLVLNIQQKGNL